jgi:hypothetical protein
MKFDSIRAGDVYYTVSRNKMGNTTMSTTAVHRVRVISCDSVKETVVASWNGNQSRTYYERDYSKWRKNEPLLVKSGFGHRLATREEIAAHKAKGGVV